MTKPFLPIHLCHAIQFLGKNDTVRWAYFLFKIIALRNARLKVAVLENRQGLIALPGFESLSLRQNIKGISYLAGSLFSFMEEKTPKSITCITTTVIQLGVDRQGLGRK